VSSWRLELVLLHFVDATDYFNGWSECALKPEALLVRLFGMYE
jgi:hypothetical protein